MYRVWLEEVLGFRLRGDRLSIEPVLPESWPGYELTFRYGKTEYHIEVVNGGRATGREIPLEDDGKPRRIRIQAGRRDPWTLPDAPPSATVVEG
jgi:cellobiose phosphorylase